MYTYIHIYIYSCIHISATGPSVPEGMYNVGKVAQSSKGPREGFVASSRVDFLKPFLCYFVDIVWGRHFSGFWCQLRSDLPANLARKSTKIRPKRCPNSKPTCILFSMAFLSILEASWPDFW